MMGFLKIFTKSTEDFILLPHVKLTTAPQTPLLRYGEWGVFKTSRVFVTEASEPNPSTPRSSWSPVFAFLSGFSRVVGMGGRGEQAAMWPARSVAMRRHWSAVFSLFISCVAAGGPVGGPVGGLLLGLRVLQLLHDFSLVAAGVVPIGVLLRLLLGPLLPRVAGEHGLVLVVVVVLVLVEVGLGHDVGG